MAIDKRTVVLAAAIQAGLGLVVMNLYTIQKAALWVGVAGGVFVAVTSRRNYGHLRDGFLAGALATAFVVLGYYLFLDGMSVDMARAAVEPHPIRQNGQVVGYVYRRKEFWFPGAAVIVGFVAAPIVGFFNGISAVLTLSLRDRVAAFNRGRRDAQ